MCYFITATLPPGADVAAVRALVAPEGSSWSALSNPFVQGQLPKGWGYYCITGSLCDCRSALVRGDAARGKTLRLPRRAAAWSEAKRNRWLEQRGLLVEGRESAARGDVVAWHEYLKRVLRAAGTPPVGVLIHFYRAGIENEDITIARRSPVKVQTTTPTVLQTLEPDVLYEFS
jgi:hypothetical protein